MKGQFYGSTICQSLWMKKWHGKCQSMPQRVENANSLHTSEIEPCKPSVWWRKVSTGDISVYVPFNALIMSLSWRIIYESRAWARRLWWVQTVEWPVMVTADEVAAWTVQPAAVALTPQDVAGCRVSTRVRLRDCNVTAYPCHPSHRMTGSEQVDEVPLGAESQHMLNHNDGWMGAGNLSLSSRSPVKLTNRLGEAGGADAAESNWS